MRQSFALLAIAITAGLIASTASGSTARTAGALELNNVLISSYYKFDRAYCPAGVSVPADCVRFTGEGTIRGLGAVTTTYTKILPGVDPACVVVQNNSAVITVAGKGTLEVSRPGTICTAPAPLTTGPYTFTVTGGTGAYKGASGTLTFRTSVGSLDGACQCGSSQDTWAGTVVVPGLEFDLTAPVITGVASKTVRVPKKAKQARVRYTVTAQDAIDGSRPVTCSPRSGSFFKVGRTKVSCSATDSSGNAARAQFVIVVKRT
jgi:hypothetical protein